MSYSNEILLREFVKDSLRVDNSSLLLEKLQSVYTTTDQAIDAERGALQSREDVYGIWGRRAEGILGWLGATAGMMALWEALFGTSATARRKGRAGLLWAQGDLQGSAKGASIGNFLKSFFLGNIRNPARKIGDMFPSVRRFLSRGSSVNESYSMINEGGLWDFVKRATARGASNVRDAGVEGMGEEDFVNLISAVATDLESIADSIDEIAANEDIISMMQEWSDFIGATFSSAETSSGLSHVIEMVGGEDVVTEHFYSEIMKPFISYQIDVLGNQLMDIGLSGEQKELIEGIFSEASTSVSR
jgi:hypothetical protein